MDSGIEAKKRTDKEMLRETPLFLPLSASFVFSVQSTQTHSTRLMRQHVKLEAGLSAK